MDNISDIPEFGWLLKDKISRISDYNWSINDNSSRIQEYDWSLLDNISRVSDFDWSLRHQASFVVLMDMSLAILSVVFNLIVITSVKEKEDMLGTTFNLVLINLCSSNLLSSVMVKSISIVHNAYAVASNSTQSDIAFCILYSFGFRLTWAVLPWSVVSLSWLTVLPRFRRLQVTLQEN